MINEEYGRDFRKVILVTGGLGFIGSNFLNKYVIEQPEWMFINFDAQVHGSSHSNLTKAVRGARNYAFVYGNIARIEDVNDAMATYGVTDIINFAAETHVDRSITHAAQFLDSNVAGTQTLLQAFHTWDCDKDGGVFLHVSTDEVYGEAHNPSRWWYEHDALNPRNIYSATKASAEHLVRAYGNVYDIDYRITRSGNNYGPNQDDSKLIPKMIKKALMGEPLEIYGDGTNFRQWTHVEDNIQGIFLVFTSGKKGEAYNIAGKDILTNNEVMSHIIDATSSKSEIKYITDRPAHDKGYAIACDKLQEHTGWNASMPFSRGIRELCDIYAQDHFSSGPSIVKTTP